MLLFSPELVEFASPAWVWLEIASDMGQPGDAPRSERDFGGHCPWRSQYLRTFDGTTWRQTGMRVEHEPLIRSANAPKLDASCRICPKPFGFGFVSPRNSSKGEE